MRRPGEFLSAKSMEFPPISKSTEAPRAPKGVVAPKVRGKAPSRLTQPLFDKNFTAIQNQPLPDPTPERPVAPRVIIEESDSESEEDASLDKYRKRFQVSQPIPAAPKKVKKTQPKVDQPEEPPIGPWDAPVLKIHKKMKPVRLILHARLKEVVYAFCQLHRIPQPRTLTSLEPFTSRPIENSTGLNLFGNWIWLGPDMREGRKPPFSIWVRGSRVYDLDSDRGSIDEWMSDCSRADRLDINREEIRLRRAKAGLPPFPYAADSAATPDE